MSAVKSEIVDIAGVHCGSVGLLSYGQGWSPPPPLSTSSSLVLYLSIFISKGSIVRLCDACLFKQQRRVTAFY